MSWMGAWKDHRRQEGWDRTHAQAEALFLLEAKFAQPLAGPEALSAWIDDMAVLIERYLNAGGSFAELHERFHDARTPLGGRFFLAEDGTP